MSRGNLALFWASFILINGNGIAYNSFSGHIPDSNIPVQQSPESTIPSPIPAVAESVSDGEWMSDGKNCSEFAIAKDGKPYFYVRSVGQSETSPPVVCIEGKNACNEASASGRGWWYGTKQVAESGRVSYALGYPHLEPNHFTLVTMRGNLSTGEPCEETYRIELTSERKYVVSKEKDDSLRLTAPNQPIQAGYTQNPNYSASNMQQQQQSYADPYGFLSWLNQVRASYGLHPVGYDPNLSAWASVNNGDQAARGHLGHNVMGTARRQNAGWGAFAQMGSMWMASPLHRAALLARDITNIGIAGNGPWWTFNAN